MEKTENSETESQQQKKDLSLKQVMQCLNMNDDFVAGHKTLFIYDIWLLTLAIAGWVLVFYFNLLVKSPSSPGDVLAVIYAGIGCAAAAVGVFSLWHNINIASQLSSKRVAFFIMNDYHETGNKEEREKLDLNEKKLYKWLNFTSKTFRSATTVSLLTLVVVLADAFITRFVF